MLFMVGAGFQEASSSLIGNLIGANLPGYAWHYSHMITAITIVTIVSLQIVLFYHSDQIVDLFIISDASGGSESTKALFREVLPLVIISFFFDAFQSQKQGVIRALNIQKSAAWATVFCYYLVAIPVAALLAFKKDMGVEGLRAGVLIGQLTLTVLYSFQIDCCTNWQRVAELT